jgi:hypothetical protein
VGESFSALCPKAPDEQRVNTTQNGPAYADHRNHLKVAIISFLGLFTNFMKNTSRRFELQAESPETFRASGLASPAAVGG